MTAAMYSPFSSSIQTRIVELGTKMSPKSIRSPLFTVGSTGSTGSSPHADNVTTPVSKMSKTNNFFIVFSL